MVAAAKAVFMFHIPQPVLSWEQGLASTSPCFLLYQLEEEVIINTAQEPPKLLIPCSVAPLGDNNV